MVTTVGNLVVNVGSDVKGLLGGLKQAESSLLGLNATATKTGSSFKQALGSVVPVAAAPVR